MRTTTSTAITPAALPWFATAAASWLALADKEARQPKPKVLIIDDEGPVREVLSLYLEGKGLEVASVRSTDGARVLVERGQFDLVILDWALAGAEGAQLLHLSKAQHPDIPVILFSRTDVEAGIASAADAVVRKGTSLEVLSAAIFQQLAQRQARPLSAA